MTPEFDLGRRYERAEVLEMLHALRTIDDGYKLQLLLSTWEQELRESLIPVVVFEGVYLVA